MISVRLAPADLARVRFVERPHPVGAAVLACQALRDPSVAALLPALADRGASVASALRPLWHLLPARGRLPDFLTPYDGLDSVEVGIEAIRATPRRRIRAELAQVYARMPTSPWRRRLAAGDRDVLDVLTAALRRFFDAVLAPDWTNLTAAHRHRVARAAQTYALSGVDGLLAGLHPSIRWRRPVLEIRSWWSADLPGTGHGLLLMPDPLAGPRPRVLVEPGRPVLLVYPAALPASVHPRPSGVDPLTRLLGGTRAAVLRRIGEPGRHTTTSLGDDVGISVSSASEHTAALRAAGLVDTVRAGRAVVHRLTPLGLYLLARAQDVG